MYKLLMLQMNGDWVVVFSHYDWVSVETEQQRLEAAGRIVKRVVEPIKGNVNV